MAIATRDVVSVPPTTPIIGAVATMTRFGFRRLPITDAGSHKLLGIVTAGDILNFLGGGDDVNLIQVKHHGNLLVAVNESVREIMTPHPETVMESAALADVIDIIVTKKIGGLPVVDEDGVLMGIVTERDVMRVLCSEPQHRLVEEIMSTSLRFVHPEDPLATVVRDMVKYRFRRMPVLRDDVLCGVIAATDIVRYLGDKQIFEEIVTGDIAEVMGLPIRNLITGGLHTTTPETRISAAAREMLQRKVGALPVVEGNRLVGIVTEFDLVRAFSQE